MRPLALLAALATSSAAHVEWGDVRVRPDLWLRVHVCSEDPTLPVLVFLSGGLGTPLMAFWQGPAEMLCGDFNVVAAEQRGVLGFNGTRASASVAEHLDDTVALIHYARRRFAQDRVYLSGISFGANMAFNISRAHPELVRAASLSAPVVYFAELDEEQRRAGVAFCETLRGRLPWYWWPLKLWLDPCTPDPDAPPPAPNYWRDIFFMAQLAVPLCVMVHCDDPPRWGNGPSVFSMMREPWYGVSGTVRIGASNVNYDITNNHVADLGADLSEPLAVPVQLIAARHDLLMPPFTMQHAAEVLRAPRKRIDWMEHSGHMIHIEEPGAWADAHRRMHAWVQEGRAACTAAA